MGIGKLMVLISFLNWTRFYSSTLQNANQIINKIFWKMGRKICSTFPKNSLFFKGTRQRLNVYTALFLSTKEHVTRFIPHYFSSFKTKFFLDHSSFLKKIGSGQLNPNMDSSPDWQKKTYPLIKMSLKKHELVRTTVFIENCSYALLSGDLLYGLCFLPC